MFSPGDLDLEALFRDPSVFESNRSWREAGFDVVVGDGDKSSIMVASHLDAPGYLFKSYSDAKVSPKDQRKNYRRRIEGADKLRALVDRKRLTSIVVPGKHLHTLPRKRSYVLVVEQIQLQSNDASRQSYREISDATLRQLCVVLRKFRGLDSGVRNVPFTTTGQIAFIDTERWDEKKKRAPLRRLRDYLSSDQWRRAKKMF